MQKRAYVCFSGGLDSTTALYLAVSRFGAENVEAVSFDYGQRHKKETEYARRSCDKLGVHHTIVALGGLLSGDGIMLTDANVVVPDINYADIKGVSPTYVPFRNGTMLSVLAAIAQKYVMEQIEQATESSLKYWTGTPGEGKMHMKEVYTREAKDLVTIYAGQHAEDATNWAYPDCTFEFLGAMANAIYLGTYNTIRLETPFVFMSKDQIVEWGTKLGVSYEDSWSCYKGEKVHCGTCPTCQSRKESFLRTGTFDPTEYADYRTPYQIKYPKPLVDTTEDDAIPF